MNNCLHYFIFNRIKILKQKKIDQIDFKSKRKITIVRWRAKSLKIKVVKVSKGLELNNDHINLRPNPETIIIIMIIESKSTEISWSKLGSESGHCESTDDELDAAQIRKSNKCGFNPKHPRSSKFKNTDKKPKYKTEMCKNFSEMGYCNYRSKCQYAHGYNEISNVVIPAGNKSYRTRKCKSFWETGVCFYGIRCQFAHHEIKNETKCFLKAYLSALNSSEESGCSRVLGFLNSHSE